MDPITKHRLKEKYGNEMVLVVPYESAREIGDRFTACKQAGSGAALAKSGRYIFRYDAEGEPSFQQLIPYGVIRRISDKKFFVYDRLAGDSRLTGKKSLGIGGHVNPEDGFENAVEAAMTRELSEEVKTSGQGPYQWIGHIRDLSSATSDHLGFVCEIWVEDASVLETQSMRGDWYTINDLYNNYGLFEGWSKYLIDFYYEAVQKS